jgi:hypothetical protein
LSYSSGEVSGVTLANGEFTYEVGGTVAFKVGGVTLGTAPGKEFVTPLDLGPANATSDSIEVKNITRFLMMLDSDGDASNGISISAAIQALANSWGQIDFTTSDLTATFTPLMNEAQIADGTTHVLPDLPTAKTHLDASVRCLYSGGFNGRYTGPDHGRFGVALFPDGTMQGSVFSLPSGPGTDIVSTLPLTVEVAPRLEAGFTTLSSSSSAAFPSDSIRSVSGTWIDSVSGLGGSLAAARMGSTTSVYRFTTVQIATSSVPHEVVAVIVFDVDRDGNITASSYLPNNSFPDTVNTFTGGTMSPTPWHYDDPNSDYELTVDLNPAIATPQILGSFNAPGSALSGDIVGMGCKLN